jgi:DNA repair protein RecO (recombination protein O)
MNSEQRVLMQPAYVLHQRPYRDSSAIVELFTPEHGRAGVVAKGIKRPRSPWRGLLQAFQPLLVSWSGRGELATLTGVESRGELARLPSAVMASGFYLNELLMRLLHRHDAQLELFSCYDATLRQLACLPASKAPLQEALEGRLRHFEVQLLAVLGYGLVLDHEVERGTPLAPEQCYRYHLDHGPMAAAGQEGGIAVHGETLLALAAGELVSARARHEAKQLMRAALGRHLGSKPLYSRQLLSHGGTSSKQQEKT